MLTERFAAEVLSILVGSIGLVLAVPLTTAIGVAVVRASGSGRPLMRQQPGMAWTGGSVRKQRAASVKEQALPKQPDGRPSLMPEPQEVATATLPRTSRSPQPAAANGGRAGPSGEPGQAPPLTPAC